jgi:hypothetical protein
MITILTKPYSKTEYYSGTYRCDVSENENEVQMRDLDFTIVYSVDHDMDVANIDDIIWIDGQPRNLEEVNDRIKEHFQEKILK